MAGPRSDLVQRASSKVGTVLKGKFHLDAVLGVGGMAAVFAATHRNGKKVAVKVLHPAFAADPELVKRFLREGYVANKIEHPGCVNVIDDDHDGDTVFLVMELLEGQSLERFTRSSGPRMPLEQILKVMGETLDVLAVAHGKGITHRDIKPANLFLTRDGRLKVLDFGIARLADGGIDGSSTQTGIAMGTPAFMPPEQARGRKQEIDARTDVWAVGATMLALLSGDRPRRAETGAEELLLAMTAPIPPLLERVPNVPKAVAAVVDRALAFERDARWPDARSMQAALAEAARALPEPAGDPSGPRIDTAPVLIGTAAEGEPTTQLATGATLAGQRSPAPRDKRTVAAIFAGSFVVALAIVVPILRSVVHHGPGAQPAGPPADLQALPAAALPPATPAVSAPAAAAEATPSPVVSALPPIDRAPPPSSAATAAKPAPPRPATHATPAPAAPNAAGNPLDRRF